MTSWSELEAAAPDFGEAGRRLLIDNWGYSSPASLSYGPHGMPNKTSDEVEVTWVDPVKESIGPAIEDDVRVFVTPQRGFRSRGFDGVYLSRWETRGRRYHEPIDDYIAGRLPRKRRGLRRGRA